jgi:hypothetical protein
MARWRVDFIGKVLFTLGAVGRTVPVPVEIGEAGATG